MTAKPRPRLFVINDPHPMRISPELAIEIGYNESVVLLQLEYLISISNTHEIENDLWTYQSLEDLQGFFPWWSLATISRILRNLEELKLIKIGCFNKKGYDRTQWFALNAEGISSLKSVCIDVAIFQNEKCKRAPIFQNEKCILQDEKTILQNETTIPESPTENPTESPSENSEEEETEIPGNLAASAADLFSENLQVLLDYGVGRNKRTKKLAQMDHLTPAYVRAHAESLIEQGKLSPGLLITVLESAQPAPQPPEKIIYTPREPLPISEDLPKPATQAVNVPFHNSITPAQAWEYVKEALKIEMPKSAFESYVKDTWCSDYLSAGSLIFKINTHDAVAVAWLKDRLTKTSERILAGIGNQKVYVEFVCTQTE